MCSGTPLSTAYENYVSPETTLAMVGWLDSDGDGIFDVLDVPLDLSAAGYFDPVSSQYHFTGTASAVPLLNQNSSGTQSDITLNRVSQLQYSLDGGDWVVAASPDQQTVDFDLSVMIATPFNEIRWRAIDRASGVTSETVTGTAASPAISRASVSGSSFLDLDGDSQADLQDLPLAVTRLAIRNADGSALFGGELDAANAGFLDGRDGILLSADGLFARDQIRAAPTNSLGDRYVFQSFDQRRNGWIIQWSDEVAFQASFDQPVGEVNLHAIGLGDGSFARVEAYDASGAMIGRVASDWIESGEEFVLHISDAKGRIAQIRAYGHADTVVAFDRIDFGFDEVAVSGPGGAFQFKNLADGDYRIELVPDLLIHAFAEPSIQVSVVDGASRFVEAAASRVDSPRHNLFLAEDVSRDGMVTAQDSLLVINDLSRSGPRNLQPSETSGVAVDVNNDGRVTALDALIVINHLSAPNGGSGELLQASSRLAGKETGTAATDQATDQALAQWAVPSPQMFNSAGSDIRDKSMVDGGTDTSEQPLVGDPPLAKLQSDASAGGLWSPVAAVAKESHGDNSPEDDLRGSQAIVEILTEVIFAKYSEPD